LFCRSGVLHGNGSVGCFAFRRSVVPPFSAVFAQRVSSGTGPGDVDHLLPEYEKLLSQIAHTRSQLKSELQEALCRTTT
jgi:hypothetical protein